MSLTTKQCENCGADVLIVMMEVTYSPDPDNVCNNVIHNICQRCNKRMLAYRTAIYTEPVLSKVLLR